jgi:hypothetical protein
VEGRLALERERSAVTCLRGHDIAVVRASHEPVGVRLH